MPPLAFGAPFYGNQCKIMIKIFFIMITEAFTLCGLSSIATRLFLLKKLFFIIFINYNVLYILCLSYAPVHLCNVVSFLHSRIFFLIYQSMVYSVFILLSSCCKLVLDSGNVPIFQTTYCCCNTPGGLKYWSFLGVFY